LADFNLRKKILGPLYRKFARPVIRKYKIKKIKLDKIKNYECLLGTELRLVGFLQMYNEQEKGNLERVLNHMKRFCDDIVIYDDGSTDNSIDLASKYTSHIIKGEKNDFRSELSHKQKLLDLALTLKPDWIIWVDGDEVFDRNGELYGIRALCKFGMEKNIDGFYFQNFNLWKDLKHYRVDETWNKLWAIKLWRNNNKLKFDIKSGLHQKLHPIGLKKICSSDIKLIHYGFSSSENIQQKYEMYKKNDQTGLLLERIKDETALKIKKFSRDWFPLSTQKIVVVALIYKSIGYLNFVYKSFKKYTEGIGENVEFLFVANDPIDKVKNYLEKNTIRYLLFRNKDPDEYYLNRVYRAWNYGGLNANSDIIVFVNSDTAFSSNWLNNLLKNLKENRVVTSRVVEPGKLGQSKYAIKKDFGRTYSQFDDDGFQKFVKDITKNKIVDGDKDFMPCAIYKDLFVRSGGYPIGNRKEKSGKIISGDWIFFYETLKSMGINHYTVFDSLVYHIQEGEMDE